MFNNFNMKFNNCIFRVDLSGHGPEPWRDRHRPDPGLTFGNPVRPPYVRIMTFAKQPIQPFFFYNELFRTESKLLKICF